MHQTKKGNQWHFGMKAHIGVDARTGFTHSLKMTSANEHDLNHATELLHGEEEFIRADAGYRGGRKATLVRCTLQKYNYPPDNAAAAVELVLKQAETLACEWSR